jgi:hypothetical protein
MLLLYYHLNIIILQYYSSSHADIVAPGGTCSGRCAPPFLDTARLLEHVPQQNFLNVHVPWLVHHLRNSQLLDVVWKNPRKMQSMEE